MIASMRAARFSMPFIDSARNGTRSSRSDRWHERIEWNVLLIDIEAMQERLPRGEGAMKSCKWDDFIAVPVLRLVSTGTAASNVPRTRSQARLVSLPAASRRRLSRQTAGGIGAINLAACERRCLRELFETAS